MLKLQGRDEEPGYGAVQTLRGIRQRPAKMLTKRSILKSSYARAPGKLMKQLVIVVFALAIQFSFLT
jgi:hypothetical protein